MPGKRKFEAVVLIDLIKEYLRTRACYERLGYVDIVRYCKEKYPDKVVGLNYQSFTRCPEVKKFVDNYNATLEAKVLCRAETSEVPQDLMLDARMLFGRSQREIEQIAAKYNAYTTRINDIARRNVASLEYARKTNRELTKEIKALQAENEGLKIEIAQKKDLLASERKNVIRLQRINTKYKTVFDYLADREMLKHLTDIKIIQPDAEVNTPTEIMEADSINTEAEIKTLEILKALE